ncbi:MAG: hypothetical protein IJ217_04635 [Clostridia bacterium]|nr:hypothetical protein [Clostridia bacterium]
MKKWILGVVALATVLSLAACANKPEENYNEKLEENNPSFETKVELSENDNSLIESVYADAIDIALSSSEKREIVNNLLVDIDHDGENELIKPTYEYMENHLHVYQLVDGNAVELENSDYVAYILSLYVTEDGVYAATIDADGLCYQNCSLVKLTIENGKVVVQEILNATCNQEVEEQKRTEINARFENGEITEDEAFIESVDAHTLEYKVNGAIASREEFNQAIAELNSKKVIRRIAYTNDLFENLWTK